MCTAAAQGVYTGVFPVKCNHDRNVLECILESGRPFSYGLEVGSKAEMLMAMAMMGSSPGALLICNGYKDAAFMRLVGPGSSWAPPCSTTPGARLPVHALPRVSLYPSAASHRWPKAGIADLPAMLRRPCTAGSLASELSLFWSSSK